MNNDDKSQAPDMPQAGYTPPPVAPGAQYPGVPNANNYNQSQTPPPYIPTVPPTPPVVPRPPASKSPMIAIIFAFIVGFALIIGGIVLNHFDKESKKCENAAPSEHSIFKRNFCKESDVYDEISKEAVFNINIPDFTSCAPSESLHQSDKKSWYDAWVECLNKTWKPLFDNAYPNKDSLDFQGTVVKVVDSLENSGSTCISDGNKTSGVEISGFYCRKEETIYIVAGYTGDIESDLTVLFHEYAHHIAMRMGFPININLMIFEMYKYWPNQPDSQDAVKERETRRSELFADTMSYAMLANTPSLKQYLVKPTKGLEPSTHGSIRALQLAYERGVKARTVGDCNAWGWNIDEVDQ